MEVIYQQPVMEKIDEAVCRAAENQWAIERIELTQDEFTRLQKETHGILQHCVPGNPMPRANGIPGSRYCFVSGVRVQDYQGEV